MLELLEDLGGLIFGDKRQTALRHFASSKQFHYKRRVNPSLFPLEVQKMPFFEGKKSRSLKGFLSKVEKRFAIDAHIFDYLHYHEFGNKTTTVYLYKKNGLRLPIFGVRPKSGISKLGSIFSSSEWSTVNKEFDKEFIVDSADMNEMRMMITIQFAEVMLDLKGYEVEGRGDYIAVYKRHDMTDIIDMDNVHDSALELIDIILHDYSNELI